MGADKLKWSAINLSRRLGWEIRRFDPSSLLADYLRYILFPHLGVNCVLDVGAHVGEYATGLRNSGYDGHIISFEPVLRSFEVLESLAAADPKWSVYNVALGAVDECTNINVMRGTNFSSLRSPLSVGVEDFEDYGNVVDVVEKVDVRRLDGLLPLITREIDNPQVFLKMDTQGWDIEVLSGAGASLDAVVGLQSELSIRPLYGGMPDFRAALSIYEDRGFVVSSLYPVGRDRQLRLAEFDCILIRSAPGEPPPN